jgi:lysophospholipid acyltransferase (LPLAT)-like uncharacterized protein
MIGFDVYMMSSLLNRGTTHPIYRYPIKACTLNLIYCSSKISYFTRCIHLQLRANHSKIVKYWHTVRLLAV